MDRRINRENVRTVSRIRPEDPFLIEENGPHEEDWNIRKRMQLWREAKEKYSKRGRESRALIKVQQILTLAD